MGTQRIEAFSDGVIAVIITITVLDLKVPADASWDALQKTTPYLLAYILSFSVVAIMWVNHHHMMHLARHATAKVLWANNVLLFWMSLIPFTTTYMGKNHGAPLAVAVYGAVLTLCALSFTVLRHVVNQFHLHDPSIATHNRRILRKSFGTTLLYASSIPLAYVSIRSSYAIFTFIPVAYFLPERSIAEHKIDPA
jgi:uncharacterized membrane protein